MTAGRSKAGITWSRDEACPAADQVDDPLCKQRLDAQVRRIRELERSLAERDRVLARVSTSMSAEMVRFDMTQAALFQAQKVESIGQMVAGLSHDLRNVVGMMTSSFQIIGRKSDDAGVQNWVKNGQLAGKQATSLIENMLGFIRPGETRLENIAPAHWLAEHSALLKHAVGPRITYRLDLPAEHWVVQVDQHRLSAAVINLAINARDAMPEGGNLTLEIANIDAGAPRPAGAPAGELLRISVIDDGQGMTPEVLARATEPLFSTKPVGKGTGLGLPMVQSFVQSFAGQLTIDSAPGAGTTVSLWLPRHTGGLPERTPAALAEVTLPADPEATSTARIATVDEKTLPAVDAGQTLLYVDDDDLSRLAMAGALRQAGYDVLEANSPEMALALSFSRSRLTAVIVSLAAAGSDGVELLLDLRRRHRSLPALLIGQQPPGSLPDGVPVLARPVNLSGLIDTITALAGQARERSQADDAYIDRLLVRMNAPALADALIGWRTLRGEARLPDLNLLRDWLQPLADWSFVAEPLAGGEDRLFRFLQVGSGLEEALGRPLSGKTIDSQESDEMMALSGAYRRAARNGLPSYEYLKFALSGEIPTLFERLILPASQDGHAFSHLIGVATFTNL